MATIYIIDDHNLTRRGISALFNGDSQDFSVAGEASTIRVAKTYFSRLQAGGKDFPDIVLLDILMKEGEIETSGLDFIPWLRALSPPPPPDESALPERPAIIVFSAFDDYGHIQAAFRLGARGYICKTQADEELEAAISTVLAGNIYVNRNLVPKLLGMTDLLRRFTRREEEVFLLIQQGLNNRQIAEKLGISRRTVENFVITIYDKTGAHSRKELEKL